MADGEPEGPDLSLIGTDDLITELKRRHDGLLLVTIFDRGEEERVVIDTHGGLSLCIGLAARASRILGDDAANNLREKP